MGIPLQQMDYVENSDKDYKLTRPHEHILNGYSNKRASISSNSINCLCESMYSESAPYIRWFGQDLIRRVCDYCMVQKIYCFEMIFDLAYTIFDSHLTGQMHYESLDLC